MSGANQPIHYIVCLHGIAVNRDVFGDFEQAFANYAKEHQYELCPRVIFFDYDTGSDNKSTADFANDLNDFLGKYFTSTPLRNGDKLSFVMHSQGGLVGTLWLWDTLFKKGPYLEHLDSFIPIAVPFWGSKIAEIWNEIRKGWDLTGKKFPLPAGKKELQEMSFLSDSIFMLREFFIAPEFEKYRSLLQSNLRPLNIAAYSKLLGGLNYILGEPGIVEGDNAVALPCARADFIYQRSLEESYQDGDTIPLSNQKETGMTPYVLVNAVHHSLTPNYSKLPGVIQIPKNCKGDNACSHPSFKYIAAHLTNRPMPEVDQDITQGLTLFSLEINLRGIDKNLKLSDIDIEFTLLDGQELKRADLAIGLPFTGWPHHKKKSLKYSNHARFQYFGDINTGGTDYNLKATIKAKGHKTRRVEFTVRVSYSTYIDINLES